MQTFVKRVCFKNSIFILFFLVICCRQKVFTPEPSSGNYSSSSSAAAALPVLSALKLKVVNRQRIDLYWSPPSAAVTGYKLYQSERSVKPLSPVWAGGSLVTNKIISGLVKDQHYYFWLEAYNENGTGPAVSNSAVPGPIPAGPISLLVTNGYSTAELSWQDRATNEQGYNIYTATNKDKPSQAAVTLGPDTVFYSMTGLPQYVTNYIWVAAYNAYDDSWPVRSTVVTGFLPKAPSQPAVTGLGLHAALSWSDNAVNEDHFNIYWATNTNISYYRAGTVAADITNFTVSNLYPDTLHYFKIEAVNLLGSKTGMPAWLQTEDFPAAPAALQFERAAESNIIISWTDNADNETGFNIFYSSNNVKPVSPCQTLPADTTNTAAAVTPYILYNFWLEASNLTGSSAYVCGSSAAGSKPDAPAELSITVNGLEVMLSWTDNSSAESGFKVYYSNQNSKPSAPAQTVTAANTMLVMPSGLTRYYFWVEAYNVIGSSVSISDSCVTAIKAPVINNALYNDQGHFQCWYDDTENEEGYRFYFATNSIKPTNYEHTAASNTTYTVDVWANNYLQPGHTYTVWLEAYAGTNTAWDTAYITVPLPPAVPAAISFTDIADNSFTVNWEDTSSNETEFRIYYDDTNVKPGTYLTTGADITSISISGLNSGTEYYVWVQSCNASGV
ncbi:MAG TPA: fibronectin type III domain-containing protein, partial [Spirochaetota bacterium]|nr:fibronectin type III domain-containing protein [Spirochaetota bacterium]